MSFELYDASVAHVAGANGRDALSGVTLSIAQGDQVALIGPSGAGKTTLLHALACAHRPRAGAFQAFGSDPWRDRKSVV